MRAVEDDDAGRLEDCLELRAPVGVVVVVPEHGYDGRLEVATGVGEHAGLLGLPLRRQVARQEDHVHVCLHVVECAHDPLS